MVACCDGRSVLELQPVVLTKYLDLLRNTLIVSTLASYNTGNQCVYWQVGLQQFHELDSKRGSSLGWARSMRSEDV